MTQWSEFQALEPEFASRVKALFDAGTNKTIATLRADGSPRISAIEAAVDGERFLVGMMPRSVKLGDVRRDGRVAIHAPTLEPPAQIGAWLGDAKVAGLLIEGDTGWALDLLEVVLTSVPNNRLRVESWHPARGYEVTERD